MPKLWKSLRWPASAYAHYLREHAASWLPFTKAGTQGQREWEREMCVLTPSDEILPQPCVYMGRFVCAGLSLYGDLRVCVCSLAYSVSCSLRFHTLIALSRNGQQHLILFSALQVSKLL